MLKNGMVFETPKDAAKCINYTKSDRNDLIFKALKHYCDFHIDNSKRVYIDNVFDEIIPFQINEYEYEIGDILENKFGKFEIIDRAEEILYISQDHPYKTYTCKCLNGLGHDIFKLNRRQIKAGAGCTTCGRNRVVLGHSLFDEHPELLEYIVNIDEAKQYTSNSSKKIKCHCPICGYEKKNIISNLVKVGFSCDICGDGVSYPNKFVCNVLDQLQIKHQREKSFNWSNNRYYDDYIPMFDIIIENHGMQHYK